MPLGLDMGAAASFLGIPVVFVKAGFTRGVASLLTDHSHQLELVPELDFVTMIMFNEDGSLTAVAEAQLGGGSARVVRKD